MIGIQLSLTNEKINRIQKAIYPTLLILQSFHSSYNGAYLKMLADGEK